MLDNKVWWQSRTIWTGLVGGLFAVLAILGIVPEGLSQNFVVESILGFVSIFSIYFRATATKSVTLTKVD